MFATLPAWLPPILLSAFGLGFYDLCKKHAVRDNPIMPVLFLATLCGSTFFVLAVVVSFLSEVLAQLPKMLLTVSLPATPSASRSWSP